MKVVCISGKAQHGKDTTALLLKDSLEENSKRVLITHYADLLKYICTKFFDWNGEKDEVGRTLLQYVGTDVIRKQQPDYWVEFITGILKLFKDEWDYVLIPDCRFPNEYETLVKNGFNTYFIRVVRENYISPLSVEQQTHQSEVALDNYKHDNIVKNTSLEELAKNAREIANLLCSEV